MYALATLPLHRWLARLDARETTGTEGELLLGATGHLLLSRAEIRNIAQQLREEILPTLFPRGWTRPVCLLTGLAPGADLLFVEVVGAWLRAAGIPHRVTGLLPLPTDDLIADWVIAAQSSGRPVDDTERNEQGTRLVDTLRLCSEVVDLTPAADAAGPLYSTDFRTQQYRRLAACLAERSQVLVAMLREGRTPKPGGTLEVVRWRSDPQTIPAEFSTFAAPGRPRQPSPLVIVDPEQKTEGATVAREAIDLAFGETEALRAGAFLRNGNYLACYDLAERMISLGATVPRLHHLAIMALANAGSTETAWRRYQSLGLRGDEQGEEDWLALEGRLLKDLAMPRGDREGLRRSAEAYLAAFERTRGFFSGVNAASMFLLAGEPERARALAAEARMVMSQVAAGDETRRYYLHVSAAEAALVLGDFETCTRELQAANPLVRDDFTARSRTRMQLRALAAALRSPLDVDALLQLPAVIHRVGDAADATALDAVDCDGARLFTAMIGPSDLDALMRLRARGALPYVVLPEERFTTIECWRAAHGDARALRLAYELDHAREIFVLRGFTADEGAWAAAHARDVAEGLAALDGERLGCRVLRLGGEPATRETACLIAEPRPFGTPTYTSDSSIERRYAGLLFADIVGFRRLGDLELPRFWDVVMGSIAHLLGTYGARVLFSHTWGDALHLVTVDALTAAELAVAIQRHFHELAARESGGLARIELRLAAHYAPVFVGHDPVEQRAMYYGSQLAFTARIEPVTPPGVNFVTEAFAAQLTREAPGAFRIDYAGELSLAKRFGRHRLFNLRARP